MEELLATNSPVSAPAVFVKIGMLSEEHLQAWRAGTVPYLERVIMGSLGKTNRVVRIISFYAHDLKLPLAPPHAAGAIKHKGRPLRFCKTGERRVEEAYKRVFNPRPPHWKKIPTPDVRQDESEPRAIEQRKLTKPGELRSFAAHPRGSADLVPQGERTPRSGPDDRETTWMHLKP